MCTRVVSSVNLSITDVFFCAYSRVFVRICVSTRVDTLSDMRDYILCMFTCVFVEQWCFHTVYTFRNLMFTHF